MTQDHVALMRRAKQQLQGQWLEAALATLIYMLLVSLASATYVGELIVYGPLTLGYIVYLLNLCLRRVSLFNLLFNGFNRFMETLVAGLLFMLIVSVASIFLIVPGIIAACGLSMTFFIMADDSNITGLDALKMSWNMMRGHKWDYFCLMFRFIGWALLCLLTFGIGYLWLYPYMTATSANYYHSLRYGTF